MEIFFLEHIISDKSIWADPNKIDRIMDWLIPRFLSEVWRFLGLV